MFAFFRAATKSSASPFSKQISNDISICLLLSCQRQVNSERNFFNVFFLLSSMCLLCSNSNAMRNAFSMTIAAQIPERAFNQSNHVCHTFFFSILGNVDSDKSIRRKERKIHRIELDSTF